MDWQRECEPGHEDVRAASAGHLALAAIAESSQATVLGATSRGLFLRSDSRWLIFLSYEPYRSPFTITLHRTSARLRAVEAKAAVRMERQRLLFPALELAVVVSPDVVWRPAQPNGEPDPHPVQVARLRGVAETALASGRNRGLAPLLDRLLSGQGAGALSPEQQRVLDAVTDLQHAVGRGNVIGASVAASRLLGLGRGLTASGDDFLIGFLLWLNRWAAMVPWLQGLNEALVAGAYKQTTTLSANLIECAARGEGDERLAAMADCLAVGKPAVGECVGPLLSWGASSGVDALAGMVAALLVEPVSAS